jgi:hypothetical protein
VAAHTLQSVRNRSGIFTDTRGGGFTISDFMKSEILLSRQLNNLFDPHRRVQR